MFNTFINHDGYNRVINLHLEKYDKIVFPIINWLL